MIFVDVDVQRDFCEPEGALYVAGSPNAAFRELTRLARERHIPVVGSVDTHAFDAWEFASNDNRGPAGEDPGFPDHCVKGTAGWLKLDGTLPDRYRFVPCVPGQDAASFAAELAEGVAQGLYFEKEVYSLFVNPIAEQVVAALSAHLGAPRFVVYGVATDYCVKAAALGLRQRSYEVAVLTDAVAGITAAGVRAALEELGDAGVVLATRRELGLAI